MIVLTSAFVLLSAFSCGGGGKATGTNEQSEKVVVNVPQFDADSAYLYVKNQVDFGPRVPNTKEHVACGNYLAGKLEAFGAKVTNQYADLIAYDGTLLKARNIIGSYKPESKKRIALFAHWDTRPWADNDADEKNHHTPILGANDGASGVGALLEIARLVNQQQPELGIDIIWLSPIYQSPFVDQGYDISNYYKIGEEFGTMEDFDTLLAETKKRGMHIIMDLVVNHCSSQHEWFQKALADPDGEYADYFYFLEGKDGNAPSNYRSYFGGSVWEKVPGSSKYYLHSFAKEQPDLNWENPTVRQKIYEMINWWLDKGVSGFRIDAIINIKKNTSFPSFPPDGDDGLVSCVKMLESTNGIGDFLQEMKKETFEKYDAFTVGEVFNMKESELPEFIGDNGHFSTKFDFSVQSMSSEGHGWYDAPPFHFEAWRDVTFAVQQLSLIHI